jgi:hypothetical protein
VKQDLARGGRRETATPGLDVSRLGPMSEPSSERPDPARASTPDQSTDDTDRGWGEVPEDDDDERFLREKPPHY